MRHSRHLVVFAREPRVGRAKTRLARGLGAVGAAFWYRRQLAALLRRLGPPGPWRRWLLVTPDRARFRFPRPAGWTARGQGGGDLGRRMRRALALPGAGPVLLVGSDIPDLDARHVRAGFRALGRAGIAIGPASDGGYWAIGTSGRRALPPLAPVRWSSRHALADTLAALGPGRRVVLLETLSDVDEAADLPGGAVRRSGRTVRARAGAA